MEVLRDPEGIEKPVTRKYRVKNLVKRGRIYKFAMFDPGASQSHNSLVVGGVYGVVTVKDVWP